MKRYSERELMTMYYKCKDCKKLYDSYITSLKKVERQLWKYYHKNYDEEKPENDENLKLSKNWRKFAKKSLELAERDEICGSIRRRASRVKYVRVKSHFKKNSDGADIKIKAYLRRTSRKPNSYREAYDGAFKKPKKITYCVMVPRKKKRTAKFRDKW